MKSVIEAIYGPTSFLAQSERMCGPVRSAVKHTVLYERGRITFVQHEKSDLTIEASRASALVRLGRKPNDDLARGCLGLATAIYCLDEYGPSLARGGSLKPTGVWGDILERCVTDKVWLSAWKVWLHDYVLRSKNVFVAADMMMSASSLRGTHGAYFDFERSFDFHGSDALALDVDEDLLEGWNLGPSAPLTGRHVPLGKGWFDDVFAEGLAVLPDVSNALPVVARSQRDPLAVYVIQPRPRTDLDDHKSLMIAKRRLIKSRNGHWAIERS